MKILFLDVDGTITDDKRKIRIEAIETIQKLRRNGFIVIATSANSYYVLKGLNRYLDLFDHIIAESGGVVDIEENLFLFADKSLAVKALKEIKKSFREIREHWSNPIRLSDQVLDRPSDENLVLSLKSFVKSRRDLKVKLVDTKFSIQIIQENINKAYAADFILKKFNANRNSTYSIGDSEADIELFDFVAHPLALSNSDGKLKEKAELISSKAYHEGFIELANYLLMKK